MTILSVYWAPGHQRGTDIDYMARLQPPAIRVLDPDVNQMSIAYRAAPNALLLPRDWALSEQHDDVRRDPAGTGKRHAQDWRNKIAVWRATGLKLPPDNQIIVVGVNEPRVWDMLPQVVEYTVAWLDECTALGLRACALNLSVGWPANNGAGTPPDWKPYAPIEAAIQRGNHFLVLHEYWYRSGPRDGWGWFAGRLQHCPWDVPIIIGECGIDMYVDMKRWENDGKPNRGWRGNVDAAQYAIQMEDYARSVDKRVVAILPFLTDYRSNNWESFDTAEAHGPLLAHKDAMMPQAARPPQPPTKPTPAYVTPFYVTAPAGANVRSRPKDGDILIAVPYAQQVDVYDYDAGAPWLLVRYGDVKGWVLATLLSLQPVTVQPTPQPEPPTGDNWSRAWPIVLKIEGGLSLDPNDTGNYYQGKLVGTKFGISAAVWGGQYDIPNLTKEQALDIYKRAYWDAAGCNALAWPMCLIHFDTAIQHGVGVAQKLLNYKPTPEEIYLGLRALRYFEDPKWKTYGVAWGNRIEHLDDIVDGKMPT